MKIYKSFDMYKYNTMRLHCIVDDYYEPETKEDVKFLIDNMTETKSNYYYLGAGSNVLLPPHLKCSVISTRLLESNIEITGNKVVCSSSVRIQHLIRLLQTHNLGGIEYLFSVPCNVGGAIYMNAGTRKRSISDFVVSIEFYNPESREFEIIEKELCNFYYRHSIFQNKKWFIVNVTFIFPSISKEEIEDKIQKRIKYSLEKLDTNKPSCGSVFNKYNSRIMQLLKGLRVGGACYSPKKANWISNLKDATYKDIRILILIAKLIHIISFQKYHLEIVIWR